MKIDLPDYVVLDLEHSEDPVNRVLREPAVPFTFPLSKENEAIIQTLIDKFDQEEDCAGLAAPQIGINKQVIIFEIPDNPELKKWRPDLTDTMPKTVWVNPSYKPLGEEKHSDYEGCFSVKDLTGTVPRFKSIRYSAYTPEGEHVEGIARGFLARVIQHEIDHLNGKLFIDYVHPKELLSIEEYRKKRREVMEKKE